MQTLAVAIKIGSVIVGPADLHHMTGSNSLGFRASTAI